MIITTILILILSAVIIIAAEINYLRVSNVIIAVREVWAILLLPATTIIVIYVDIDQLLFVIGFKININVVAVDVLVGIDKFVVVVFVYLLR